MFFTLEPVIKYYLAMAVHCYQRKKKKDSIFFLNYDFLFIFHWSKSSLRLPCFPFRSLFSSQAGLTLGLYFSIQGGFYSRGQSQRVSPQPCWIRTPKKSLRLTGNVHAVSTSNSRLRNGVCVL